MAAISLFGSPRQLSLRPVGGRLHGLLIRSVTAT